MVLRTMLKRPVSRDFRPAWISTCNRFVSFSFSVRRCFAGHAVNPIAPVKTLSNASIRRSISNRVGRRRCASRQCGSPCLDTFARASAHKDQSTEIVRVGGYFSARVYPDKFPGHGVVIQESGKITWSFAEIVAENCDWFHAIVFILDGIGLYRDAGIFRGHLTICQGCVSTSTVKIRQVARP